MTHRQGSSWFRIAGLFAVGLAASALLDPNAVSASNNQNINDYKGAATLFVVSVGPNAERCGDAPVFEVIFEGSGIDTAGGITTIESSACQNVATGEVFDLVAVDTYANGDTVIIESDTFFLELDPDTCTSTNTEKVHFDIGGGTGTYANATGGGKYDIALNDPNCNGVVTPAYIWFRGKLRP